jgi:DNA polymerase-3 subunit alpha
MTWDLISDGNTKGVFQLDSQLGQSSAEKLKPHNIEELAALSAIIRPGCSESILDGKSLTQHFIDRKNKKDPVDYFHPVLEPILRSTYGILVYQEQALFIARDVAGFNLQEADTLRKAIGKKKPEEMAKVKTMFLTKAKEVGVVTEQEAEEIFGWIEKSQRYSFNKSHAVSYAYNSYLTAFCKAHFSKEFFTSCLYYAREKPKTQEEVHDLVSNAKRMDIDVLKPDIKQFNKRFSLVGDQIVFGITDIKGVGNAVFDSLKETIHVAETQLQSKFDTWDWTSFLVFVGAKIKSDSFKSIIDAGALDLYKESRTKMGNDFNKYIQLKDREQDWIKTFKFINRNVSLVECFNYLLTSPTGKNGGIYLKRRVQEVESLLKSLINPGFKLEDSPHSIAMMEKELLGIEITYTKVDGCDTASANCTCKDFYKKDHPRCPIIAVVIDRKNEIKCKRGNSKDKEMAFLTVSDSTCSLDSVTLFPEQWKEYKHICDPGKTILISGSRDPKTNALIVKKMWEI